MLHLWSRLRPHARPYLAPLILSGGLTLLLATFDLAAPWPLKIAVDHVIGRAPVGGPFAPLNRLSPLGLTAAAALMGLGLVAVAGGLRFLRAWLVGSATESLGADLRAAAFARLQRRSLRFHDRHQSGELVARLTTDISRIQDIVASTVQHVASDVLTLAGVFTVMVWLDVQLALAALDIVPGLVLLVFSTTPRIKTLQREARDRQAGLAAWAVERLRHIRAVRAFGREQEEDRTFRQAGQAVVTTSLQTLRVQALFSIAADLILAGGGALILFVGVQAVLAARMSIGELLVILTYLGSLYRPIRSLARLGSDLAKGAASWERLRELLEEEDDDVESPRVLAVGRSRSASPGPAPIEIDDVAFAYRPLVPVLRRISLGIEPGETLAIVGPSGAGKSTLLWLLLRFYDPDGGRITLGGTDLRRLDLAWLRRQFALVPQDPWILDGTIADNIRFGRPGAVDEAVVAAGRAAMVEEFAASLPAGYDTPVGEDGIRLSGGQRRRIALARALLRDAPVLLLDEPTSGLDAGAGAQVIDALRRTARGRTVIIVSHDLRCTEIASRLVVLRDGRIVEDGGPVRRATLVAGVTTPTLSLPSRGDERR